jgi:AraC-like DNA-binding protein
VTEILQKSADSYRSRGHLNPEGFKSKVNFTIHKPPADLAQFVKHFWVISWEDLPQVYHSSQVMHQPFVDIFISATESGIQGTFRGKRTYVAEGTGKIIGARFRPGAFHAIWKNKMSELQDTVVPLERLFPQLDAQELQRLLATPDHGPEFTELIRSLNPQPDPNIEIINQLITTIEADDSNPSVTEIARKFGRSERWVQALFTTYVGVGLKWFLKRHMLLSATERIRQSEQPDWTAIAYDLGYSSQQHFITDFKSTVGLTPLQYKKHLEEL